MFRMLVTFATLIFTVLSSSTFADCCQSGEITFGWRRDNLKWKLNHLDSCYIPAHVKDRILFKDFETYTASTKLKWADSEYYIRFSAEYGLSEKGRAHEHFKIRSPLLDHPVVVNTSDPIKRRSEVYDFNIAVGYPFNFFCCRLSAIPLVGFSFHRQHIRVKSDEYYCCSYSSCSYDSSNCCDCGYGSSAFCVESHNPFAYPVSHDPFGSPSDPTIAGALGLCTPHHTSMYRFTWYGFYVGADIAYALDSCWTLFSELEVHFLDSCHRKRESWTGVYFVDDYHHKGWAYGFNGVCGLTYTFATCWYSTIAVDFNWWKGHSKHDDLHWNMVGAKIGLGYMF